MHEHRLVASSFCEALAGEASATTGRLFKPVVFVEGGSHARRDRNPKRAESVYKTLESGDQRDDRREEGGVSPTIPGSTPPAALVRGPAPQPRANPRASDPPRPRDSGAFPIRVCEWRRDRALLLFGFASGGRRRSEIAAARCEDGPRERLAAARQAASAQAARSRTGNSRPSPDFIAWGWVKSKRDDSQIRLSLEDLLSSRRVEYLGLDISRLGVEKFLRDLAEKLAEL
jgi:hypothetical protein